MKKEATCPRADEPPLSTTYFCLYKFSNSGKLIFRPIPNPIIIIHYEYSTRFKFLLIVQFCEMFLF